MFLSVLHGLSQVSDHNGTCRHYTAQSSSWFKYNKAAWQVVKEVDYTVFSHEKGGGGTTDPISVKWIKHCLAKGLWNVMTLHNYKRFEFKVSDEKKLWNRAFRPLHQFLPHDSEDHLHLCAILLCHESSQSPWDTQWTPSDCVYIFVIQTFQFPFPTAPAVLSIS